MQETGQIPDCGFYLPVPVSMSRNHPVLGEQNHLSIESLIDWIDSEAMARVNYLRVAA